MTDKDDFEIEIIAFINKWTKSGKIQSGDLIAILDAIKFKIHLEGFKKAGDIK